MRHRNHPCPALLAALPLLLTACGGGDRERPAPAASANPPAAVTVGAGLAAAAADTVTVAWTFDLAEGWHLYWDGLNDSGYPPSVQLELPAGWRAGPLRWPVPERYVMAGGILDHVYHRRLVLLQDLVPPGGARPAAATPVAATVRWLACREACVPGQASLTVAIPGADTALPPAFADLPPFPGVLPGGAAAAAWHGDTLAISSPGAAALRFFPEAASGPYLDLVADGEAAGDRLDLRLRRQDGALGPVRGLLQIERPDGTRLTGPFAVPTPADDNPGG